MIIPVALFTFLLIPATACSALACLCRKGCVVNSSAVASMYSYSEGRLTTYTGDSRQSPLLRCFEDSYLHCCNVEVKAIDDVIHSSAARCSSLRIVEEQGEDKRLSFMHAMK